MSLTKQEFDELVAKAGVGALSDEEAAALEPYRTHNAIILAAGTCRRCAPISFDYPKPLIEVRGERIIERQIRQLLSAGISDITVVVGFMKEKFEYLGEKYGVKFVESPEFATTNTTWSLYEAREQLGNSYILLGDQFFTVNPFERYVFHSYYATTLTESDNVWVMETNPDGVVTDMVMSADGGEKLQGPCYVDAETGAALAAALEEAHTDWHNKERYWEYIWYTKRDSIHIVTRYYPKGVVYSFDTMDELYKFDDSYLLHVESPSMDNICGLLDCTYEDMYDFEPLMAGLTNYLVAFNVGDKRYVYRHPVGYAPMDLNRRVETIANKAAFEAGVDPSFIYEDPETGWKLNHFIEGAHGIDRMNADEATPASRLLGVFQEATKGITVDDEYDRWELCEYYEKQLASRGYEIDAHTMSYRDRVLKLVELVEKDNFPKVLSHNDAWYANFLWDANGTLNLIDWEYAGMADWLSDVANHAEAYYISVPPNDRDFLRTQLRAFLNRDYTPEEWRHFMALVMIACWKVSVWTVDFISASDAATEWDVDVWLGLSWGLFDEQLDYTLSLYENE